MKKLFKKAIYLAIPLVFLTNPVKAQEFKIDSRINVEDGLTMKNRFSFRQDFFELGLNNTKFGNDINTTLYSLFQLDNTKLIFYLSDELEGKINQDIGDFTLDFGGKKDIFHTGILYGKFKHQGIGIGYLQDVEIRGQAWKYFENFWRDLGLFVGFAKRKQQARTIISMADENFGVKYSGKVGLDEELLAHEITIGTKPRTGFWDSYFHLNDCLLFGKGALKKKSSFGYLKKPLAWNIRGTGFELYRETGEKDIFEVGGISYLTDKYWLGPSYRIENDSDSVTLNFGRTVDNLLLGFGVGYNLDDNNPLFFLQVRSSF